VDGLEIIFVRQLDEWPREWGPGDKETER
jgi:hypothetical protein